MRPRVHHLEGSEPVYDGGDCFRMGRSAFADLLGAGAAVDWRGYFAEASVCLASAGPDVALRNVLEAHRTAFSQDIRDSELWEGLVRVANEVYGA